MKDVHDFVENSLTLIFFVFVDMSLSETHYMLL